MKTILSILFFLTLTATAADVLIGWKNGDNPTATTNWNTVIAVGVVANVYTNQTFIPYGGTNYTITNLVSGQRYYFAVKHSDGTDESVYSNEVNAKTKPNPPKNAVINP